MTNTMVLNDLLTLKEYYSSLEKWYQGSYFNWGSDQPIAPSCLMGQIYRQAISYKSEKAVTNFIENVIVEHFPDRVRKDKNCIIPYFNDHINTTFDDIVRVLDLAIEKARKQDG